MNCIDNECIHSKSIIGNWVCELDENYPECIMDDDFNCPSYKQRIVYLVNMIILQTWKKLWFLEQIALGKPYKISVLRAGYWEVTLEEDNGKMPMKDWFH